jgi:hypothetical protein
MTSYTFAEPSMLPSLDMASVCSIDHCSEAVVGRGWCRKHYNRWHRHGDPLKVRTADDRFWAKVNKGLDDDDDDCWLWLGTTNEAGYGLFCLDNKVVRAHRYAFGDVENGLVLDHLCRTRNCVNPRHLEPVTIGENVLRGENPPAWNSRKTKCIHGHPLSGDNLYVDPGGRRQCRACRREAAKRDYWRKKESDR